MKSKPDSLIAAALDNRLDPAARAEWNELLRTSSQARREYLRLVRIHAELHRLSASGNAGPSAATIKKFPTRPQKTAMCAAAMILLAFAFFWNPSPQTSIATLQTRSAIWDGAAPQGESLTSGQSYSLKSGFASLTFTSGVEVTLQAPCRFNVTNPMAMSVNHGRASVRVPEHVNEFIVSTPGGDFVDLGTEFGIAVGSDGSNPVVLADVFSGEIEIRPASQEPHRLKKGEARALLGKGATAKVVANLDFEPVALGNIHRQLPETTSPPDPSPNLALGKPVFSPAYLTRPHGSVFPPQNLTDGYGEDSGVPGDWSFWLAPDGEPGEFTVDLLESHTISRIELQNTRNRHHGDRGMKRFRLLVSTDNRDFILILEDELDAVPLDATVFSDASFTFPPVAARYVKIQGIDHHRSPHRPANHPHQGGGLNEIRIFAH